MKAKTWINIDGMNVNLACISAAEEIGPQGIRGYKLFLGGHRVIEFHVDRVRPEGPLSRQAHDELTDIATRIRCYLYDHQIPNNTGGQRDDDY